MVAGQMFNTKPKERWVVSTGVPGADHSKVHFKTTS